MDRNGTCPHPNRTGVPCSRCLPGKLLQSGWARNNKCYQFPFCRKSGPSHPLRGYKIKLAGEVWLVIWSVTKSKAQHLRSSSLQPCPVRAKTFARSSTVLVYSALHLLNSEFPDGCSEFSLQIQHCRRTAMVMSNVFN